MPNELLDAFTEWGLSPLDVCLYLVVLRRQWGDGPAPREWVKTMAGKLNVVDRTIQRSMRRLEDVGLISVEARIGAHGGSISNLYHPRLLARQVTSGGRENQGVVTFTPSPGDTGVTPYKKKPGPEKPVRRTRTDQLRPRPLQHGQCFGCGGDHLVASCPKYGYLDRKRE